MNLDMYIMVGTKLKCCGKSAIDWNGYNMEFYFRIVIKLIIFYNKFFEHINKKLDSIEIKSLELRVR